jgi:LPXTG-motif cell wall-anchored protein
LYAYAETLHPATLRHSVRGASSNLTGANTMSWWKILILYLLLVGGMLWFLRRSRSFHDESEESQAD